MMRSMKDAFSTNVGELVPDDRYYDFRCTDASGNVWTAQALDPESAVWYYRAGFLAIELLEKSGQWEGAARMAERLAQAGGDRAIEAKDVATKIRLERFLWDDKP